MTYKSHTRRRMALEEGNVRRKNRVSIGGNGNNNNNNGNSNNVSSSERNAKAPSLDSASAMQRRGINKRLSFAEAENGQKDRNEEEVEEEREPATEKGINKSGSAQGKKG